MTDNERPGLYRQEAVDAYTRLDGRDAAPDFDPGAAMPRRRSIVAGVLCMAALVASGLAYRVDRGPGAMVVYTDEESIVLAFTEPPPDLVGERVVMTLPDGGEIEGTGVQSEQATAGGGITATTVMVELDSPGSADSSYGETVLVNAEAVPLLLDLFDDEEGA
ncbi:hypothetical protein [Glycomyces salinus]|uniref:hypothetical protein n=1 Tax=Glycomyces salinus TaxID=980294 RepID=UPI0018EDDE29|nr:hypothetical protein [Glycomyces salinus]